MSVIFFRIFISVRLSDACPSLRVVPTTTERTPTHHPRLESATNSNLGFRFVFSRKKQETTKNSGVSTHSLMSVLRECRKIEKHERKAKMKTERPGRLYVGSDRIQGSVPVERSLIRTGETTRTTQVVLIIIAHAADLCRRNRAALARTLTRCRNQC